LTLRTCEHVWTTESTALQALLHSLRNKLYDFWLKAATGGLLQQFMGNEFLVVII